MRELLPMGSIHLRGGRVTVHIGAPIPTVGLKLADRVDLTERVYAEISRMLGHPPKCLIPAGGS